MSFLQSNLPKLHVEDLDLYRPRSLVFVDDYDSDWGTSDGSNGLLGQTASIMMDSYLIVVMPK